jgi:hypothetical protein
MVMSCRILLCIVLLVLGVLLLPNAEANSGELRIVDTAQERPKDFYAMRLNGDPAVCTPLFTVLSQDWHLEPYQVGARTLLNAASIGRLFLGNPYNAQWRRRQYHWRHSSGVSTGDLEMTEADLDNDGAADSIYRFVRVGKSGASRDFLYLLEDTPVPAGTEPLSAEAYDAIVGPTVPWPGNRKNQIVLHPRLVPEMAHLGVNTDSPPTYSYFFDVATVGSKTVLLAASAAYWREPVDVLVLDYRSHEDVSVLCQLRARYRVETVLPLERK